MKNILFKLTFCICIATGLACKKNFTPLNNEQKILSTRIELKNLINKKLYDYAIVISSLSRNEMLRTTVRELVSKKFDGDNNVLIKDLYVALEQKIKNNPQKLQSGKSEHQTPPTKTSSAEIDDDYYKPKNFYISNDLNILKELVSEPITVNGDTLYPQIYIPFFDNKEDLDIEYNPCGENSLILNSTYDALPIIIPYDGDETEEQETFTGYTYNLDGEKVIIENISECDAFKNTVWAITINERVDDSGNIKTMGTT